MYLDIIKLLVGLFVLIIGGDFLVKGASSIAFRFRLSALVVGLTIVAFGTSAPELLISIRSALAGSPDLTMGNVVGSNICNLGLVLGVTAIIGPVAVGNDSLRIDWPVAMGSALLLFFIAKTGVLVWYEGLVFVTLLITYIVFLIIKSRKKNLKDDELEAELDVEGPSDSIFKDIGYLVIGCAGLYFGADWFVGGAQTMALYLGMSERVIGITVVALGTSLPELTTAIISSLKGETDLALGNLLGSNIFNILSILGITSFISTIDINQAIVGVDMLWMLGITFITLPFMITGMNVERWEGVVLIVVYFYYVFVVIL